MLFFKINQLIIIYSQLFQECKKLFIIFGFPYQSPESNRVGSNDCAKKIRDEMKQFKSYDLTHQLYNRDICILDLGDIVQDLDMNNALDQLYKWVAEIYNQCRNAVVIVLGGTRDQIWCLDKSLNDGLEMNNKIHDVILLDKKITRQDNYENNAVQYYGLQGGYVSQIEAKEALDKGHRLYYLQRDIRRGEKDYFREQVLGKCQGEVFHVSLNMEVVNSAYFEGMEEPSVIGLSDVELLEIIEQVVQSGRVRLLNISGYNPSVECNRSGKLMCMILNKFLNQKQLYISY